MSPGSAGSAVYAPFWVQRSARYRPSALVQKPTAVPTLFTAYARLMVASVGAASWVMAPWPSHFTARAPWPGMKDPPTMAVPWSLIV